MKEGETSFLGEIRKKAGKIAKATVFAAGLAAGGSAEAQEVGSQVPAQPSLYEQMVAKEAAERAAWEKEKADKKVKEEEIAHARSEARSAAQRAMRNEAPDEAKFEEMVADNAEAFLSETVQPFIESCEVGGVRDYIRDRKGLVYSEYSEGRDGKAYKPQEYSEIQDEGYRMEAVRIATAKKLLSVLEGATSIPHGVTQQWATAVEQLNTIIKRGSL